MPNSSRAEDGWLLDRTRARKEVQRQWGGHLALLAKVIDEGVRLLESLPEATLDPVTEQVLYGGFLRRGIVILDTIYVLLEEGQVLGARSPLRTLIELSWQLEWLLRGDTDHRAERFYIASLRMDRAVAERALARAVETAKILQERGIPANREPGQYHRNTIERIDEAIRTDERLRAVNTTFEAERQKRERRGRKGDPYWFAFEGGPSSYFQLASALGHEQVYTDHYTRWSEVVHSSNLGWDILASEQGGWDVRPIREPDSVIHVWSIVSEEAVAIYRRLIRFTHPSSASQFEQRVFTWLEALERLEGFE
jgi:hypothetical protein